MPVFYLAWVNEGVAFSPVTHATVTQKVWDGTEGGEIVFSLEIDHAEGDFAGLKTELVNPRIGLLSAGRNQWVWLSADFGSGVEALFNGRIIGVPQRLADEVIEVEFIARPADFIEQKEALAETLRELPWHDRLFLQEAADAPDTVLETRAMRWHIGRADLVVTASSITEGEDGTIDISADEHFYDGIAVTYGPQPKRRIKVKLTGAWTQTGEGEVDLTRRLVNAFKAAGSPYQWPMVSSYTADGLLDDWPKPLASLGGGWSMAANSSAAAAEFVASSTYAVRYTDKSDSTTVLGHETEVFNAPLTKKEAFFVNWKNFEVIFETAPIVADFRVTFAAERKRSEVVTFTVSADVQSILIDPDAAEEETLELSTTFIDQPVDIDPGSPSGMLMPIGDLRRNAYFPTDRGEQSLQYGMLIAVAKLLSSARAVDIKFASTWEKLGLTISCRKSVTLHDPRLPGGEATGKIKTYRLVANGDGQMIADATIGCMIGYGVALDDAAAGDDVYATGYSTGYTASTGGEVAVIPGQVHYERLDGSYIIDDDGVDLFNMTPETVINSLTVTDGPTEQRWAIDGSLSASPADLALQTTGDIVTSGSSSIENLADVTGLISGTTYNISGVYIPNPWTISRETLHWYGDVRMMMTFNGTDGGTLNHPIAARANVTLQITSVSGAVLTPDPLAALDLHPTEVALDLVPVTGGDFMTEYDVVVLPVVIPIGINLEAAA